MRLFFAAAARTKAVVDLYAIAAGRVCMHASCVLQIAMRLRVNRRVSQTSVVRFKDRC